MVIWRTIPHWSFRIASLNFKLGVNLYQWVFLLLSSIEQKIFTWKTLARVATYKQNGPGLWKLPKRAILTSKKLLIVGFATSANKQPQVSHKIVNNNCLFWWHLCKPSVIPLFASINVYTIVTWWKKNVLIEGKHDMLSHQTFEFFFSGGGGWLDKV